MRSINEAHEADFEIAIDDLMELDPEFLNAIAGGSGGDECCPNPRISGTCYPGGGCTTPVIDCSDWRSC